MGGVGRSTGGVRGETAEEGRESRRTGRKTGGETEGGGREEGVNGRVDRIEGEKRVGEGE